MTRRFLCKGFPPVVKSDRRSLMQRVSSDREEWPKESIRRLYGCLFVRIRSCMKTCPPTPNKHGGRKNDGNFHAFFYRITLSIYIYPNDICLYMCLITGHNIRQIGFQILQAVCMALGVICGIPWLVYDAYLCHVSAELRSWTNYPRVQRWYFICF